MESLLTLGLLGIAITGVMSLTGSTNKSVKVSEGQVARNHFTASLNSYLNSSIGCDDLKVARVDGGAFSTTPSAMSLTMWNYQGFTTIRGGTNALGERFTPFTHIDLAALDATLEPITAASKVTAGTTAGTQEELFKTKLNIRAEIVIGGAPRARIFNLPVLVDSTGVIKFCGDEKIIAESCAAIKGKYDPVTKKCTPNESCILKDTYSILTCTIPAPLPATYGCSPLLGIQKNNSFTGGQSCPTGSVSVETDVSDWDWKVSCGKKCTSIVVNRMRWFSCMACPP